MTNTAQDFKPRIKMTTNKEIVKYNLDGSVKKTHSNRQKGVSSEVYAFNTQEDINNMINVLNEHIFYASTSKKKKSAARNKLLFILGINLGIRASDLRSVRWSFFFDDINSLCFKDCYTIMPKKTANKSKYVTLYFNKAVKTAIMEYVSEYPIDSIDDYLFTSQKGSDEAIEESSIWRIIKATAAEAGIKQNIGSHSLRKTFGYWIWHNAEDKNEALCILQMVFNHSSPATTAKYIGITDGEIKNAFNSIALGI